MKKFKPVITIGILSMALTVGICIQLKTIKAANLDDSIQISDSNLKKYLLQVKSNNEELTQKLKDTDNELENMRKSVVNVEEDQETKDKIKKYEVLLGLTKVQGAGIVVTVADNTNKKSGNSFESINDSNYLVHDGNLVAIINELKIAGAEAISINGHRIVNSTNISCAGNVIQINGERVGSPFVISAIGDKDLLYGEITKNGGTLYKLKKYGIITNVKKEDSIEIDKEI